MRYLSVCSGVETASVAWHDLGWTPVGFSEIEPFPSAVLAHRFPSVKNYGDMTKYKEWDIEPGTVDVLVGGTPCQSFSVAGLRKGLNDPRGNLMLVYLGLAEHLRVPWLVWENVPGVLSSNGGRDFGTFLGALGELGYRWAFRVLDAQHFGVPQRRRRVFVVAHLGDGEHPASVLFEPESLRGNSAKGGKTRQGSARGVGKGAESGGRVGVDIVGTLCSDTHPGAYSGQDAYSGRLGAHIQPVPFDTTQITSPSNYSRPKAGDPCHPLAAGAHPPAIAFHLTQDPISSVEVTHALGTGSKGGCATAAVATEVTGTLSSRATAAGGLGTDFEVAGGLQPVTVLDTYNQSVSQDVTPPMTVGNAGNTVPNILAPTLTAANDPSRSPQSSEVTQQVAAVLAAMPTMAVRRLLPVECERLQGFPDDWTNIPWRGKPAPDGPR
jgi:DNA (cytosine-5)-methyltransferase 1